MTVTRDEPGLRQHAMHRLTDVGAAEPLVVGEVLGDVVDGVDECEDPNLRELLAQRVDELQRELREPGYRTRYVADDHQFGAPGARLAVLEFDRNPARRHRRAQRRTDVDCTPVGAASSNLQAGGQQTRERGDGPSDLGEVLLACREEVDVLGQRRHRVVADLLASVAVGHPTLRLHLDRGAQAVGAFAGGPPERRIVADAQVVTRSARHRCGDPCDQCLGIDARERLIRRVRLPAARLVAAHLVDHLRDRGGQTSVCVGRLVCE